MSEGCRRSWGTEGRRGAKEAEVSDMEVEELTTRRSQGSRVRGCFYYPRNDDEGPLL